MLVFIGRHIAVMHIGTISFCDRVGYNIKSDQVKKEFLTRIESEYGIKIIQKHFEKFNENSIALLNNNPHYICTKTNGNPYLFYLTKYNDVNQCIFIDKKVQQGYFFPRMILVKAWFDEDLFDGTLIDGEMVKDKDGNWVFIANDLIVHNGVYMSGFNLMRRLERLADIFKNKYTHDSWIAYCTFQVKRYFHYQELQSILDDFIPSLPYTIRGILFKSLHLKFKDILINFDDNLVKKVCKTKYKHVSDFLTDQKDLQLLTTSPHASPSPMLPPMPPPPVLMGASDDKERVFFCKKTSTPDVYELQEDSSNSMVHIACVPTLKTSTMLREAMAGCNVVDRIRVCCVLHEKFNRWMPIRIL